MVKRKTQTQPQENSTQNKQEYTAGQLAAMRRRADVGGRLANETNHYIATKWEGK